MSRQISLPPSLMPSRSVRWQMVRCSACGLLGTRSAVSHRVARGGQLPECLLAARYGRAFKVYCICRRAELWASLCRHVAGAHQPACSFSRMPHSWIEPSVVITTHLHLTAGNLASHSKKWSARWSARMHSTGKPRQWVGFSHAVSCSSAIVTVTTFMTPTHEQHA